jgi:outer membrane PBP1 activator LpoA protein
MKKTLTFMLAAVVLFGCESRKSAEENQPDTETPATSSATAVNQLTEAQKNP